MRMGSKEAWLLRLQRTEVTYFGRDIPKGTRSIAARRRTSTMKKGAPKAACLPARQERGRASPATKKTGGSSEEEEMMMTMTRAKLGQRQKAAKQSYDNLRSSNWD